MKKYFKIIISAIIVLSIGTSCVEDWLEVKPQGMVVEEDLFKDGTGCRSVLNGLYKKMASYQLYGAELQFAYVDCLSQQYELEDNFIWYEGYKALKNYDYTNDRAISRADNIWANAYNIIANANNLIQNLESKNPEMFELKEIEKNMIIGEALAVRSLLHFDLLRLFGDAPVTGIDKAIVPYVDSYPNVAPTGVTTQTMLTNLIDDLKKAKDLVVAFDTTSLGKQTMVTGKARFYNDYPYDTDIAYGKGGLNDFFRGRGYHMNSHAITALLARVYQYNNQHKEAFECVEELLGLEHDYYADRKELYYITRNGIGGDFENKSNLKRVESLIFGVYDALAYENLNLELLFKKEQTDQQKYYFVVKVEEIFTSIEGDNESLIDARNVDMIYPACEQYPISGKWFWSDNETTRDKNVTIMPIIRISEMYYIAAEYYARIGEFGKAAEMLDFVRVGNGLNPTGTISSLDEFKSILINDARREWISEGQMFYLYKRLNAKFKQTSGEVRTMTRKESVVPVPLNQSL